MFTKKSPILIFSIILMIVQLACNAASGSSTPEPFATINGIYTASALTLEAAMTPTGQTATPGLPLPTAAASAAASATNTLIPTVPAPASRCDAAQFLADVTYPDGSLVTQKNSFVKIWRIKNIGTCAWTPSYALVFTGGDQLGGPSSVALAGNVNPGQYIEIPVTFTAPNKDGKYRGYWKLRNASGVLFGIGSQADTAFWVDIKVIGPGYVGYDFTANYCSANWENKSAALPCPGTDGDGNGFVVKLSDPVLEDGAKNNPPGLLTVPQDKRDGIISGQYPSFTVQSGDRFRATIGCQTKSKKCDVIFRLDYKINGEIKTLGSWREVFEGKVYPIDLDLNSLAGKTVKFILVVNSNGPQNSDNAVWLNPRITRQGTPPTATATPANTFTPTATLTSSLTPTVTSTGTVTPTGTPTSTATATPTSTPTP